MVAMKRFVFGLFFLLAALNVCVAEGSNSEIRLDVKDFKLHNGMMFLVVERPTTPQVACRLAIRTGSALEVDGKTGLVHLLEHMMFKGTKNFGSVDIKKDQELQKRIEAAFQTALKEEAARNPDKALIESKLAEMNRLRTEVQQIYVPHAFSSQLEKNGAVGVNAFTSKDQTQYTASIPSDMVEQWFSIISEQLFEPSWREFYVEREIIQREWAFRYVNNPGGAAWLDLFSTAYQAHPYGNPTIGWKSDMEKLSTRDAVAFHKTHYNPTNAVCVLVGDITVQQAKALAETYFERYPAGARSPERVTREPPQQGPRKSVRYLKGARTPLIRIGFHTAPMGTNDFYALDVLSSVLSQGRSARIRQNIIEEGLAVEAWGYNPDSRYGSMFILGGSPNEPDALKHNQISEKEKRKIYVKACEDLEKVLLDEVERLKTELITEQELKRVKKLNQRSFLDRMRSNEQLADSLTTLEIQVGWQYMTTYLENLASVTPDQVREAAKKYLVTENKTRVYVIPGGSPDQPPERYAEIRSAERPSLVQDVKGNKSVNHSIYTTPEGWKHPLFFERHPEKIIYPKVAPTDIENAKLFFLPDRELPLIDLSIHVKAGEVDVDDSKEGLSEILNGSIIRGGTEKHSPSDLALALDENAIQLSFSIHEEETVIALSVMKEDWEKGLALLEEILLHPAFDEKVLDVTKQQALTSLNRQGGDAWTVCRREAAIRHFKGHVYGRDPLLGLDTIPEITRNDLKSFLDDYFVPANMVVAVSGDIDKERAIGGLKDLFAKLSKDQAQERSLDIPKETPPVLGLIHKPGQVQSQVALILPGLKRTHPSYWKMALLMNVLGSSGSLMYTRLRDDLGLIYAGGFFQTYKWQAGMLFGYIGCKGDKTAQALNETVRIMIDLKRTVPSKLLEQKRLDALNGFVFNVDTTPELLNTYAAYHMRGEPLDTLERIQDAFMDATREELEALAGELLDPKKLQIFVVGDKTTKVKQKNGVEMTLEEDLKALAKTLGLPYEEIVLR